MVSTGIRQLKNNLSRYVSSAKEGKIILITEHGKPVARLVREASRTPTLRDRLAPLALKGLVHLPERDLSRDFPKPVALKGGRLSHWVVEDRR
ncbi:MAG: type II toxin-antitoxin system prevent-host-death family antitoxin [Deltaproteobacteria bacterium]|nr:type II toxin-antitoxin system prevent-host-death family antitoxin [Deltaproteobacteria bacterium]